MREYNTKDDVTINPSTLDGSVYQGQTVIFMKKGAYNFYNDVAGGYPTSTTYSGLWIATDPESDSVAKYTFYGSNGGPTTGISNFCARFDYSWPKPSDNYGMYNNYLSQVIFSNQSGRYTEWFNHFAATFTANADYSRVGTITGLFIESLKKDSINRAWGVLQTGVNDYNGFKGKMLIGDTAWSNVGSNQLYVNGKSYFTDNLGINTSSPSEKLEVNGNISLASAGNKIKIATGSNASVGTGTFSSGTATINTTAVSAGSLIFVQYTSCNNCGSTYIGTITAGTSFVVNSTNGSDSSGFNWWIVN